MTEQQFDEIGNPINPPAATEIKKQFDGYMFNYLGKLTMFMSGAYWPDEFAAVIQKWDCVGFAQIKDSPLTADNSDEYLIEGANTTTPTIARRKPMPLLLDGMVLKGVPDGGMITIEGRWYYTDGTDIELEFGALGKYTVTCKGFPYLTTDIEVNYENQA